MKGNCGYVFNVSKHKINFYIFKNNLLVSKMIKKFQNSTLLLKWSPPSLSLFCKSLKANLDKIKISPLTVSKFKHGILHIICYSSKGT